MLLSKCVIRAKYLEPGPLKGDPQLLRQTSTLPKVASAISSFTRRSKPRLRALYVKSALYHLPSDLQSSVQTGLGIAWLLALPFSALPILTGESKEKNEQRALSPSQTDSAANIRWSVMGVLSLVPYFNWLVR